MIRSLDFFAASSLEKSVDAADGSLGEQQFLQSALIPVVWEGLEDRHHFWCRLATLRRLHYFRYQLNETFFDFKLVPVLNGEFIYLLFKILHAVATLRELSFHGHDLANVLIDLPLELVFGLNQAQLVQLLLLEGPHCSLELVVYGLFLLGQLQGSLPDLVQAGLHFPQFSVLGFFYFFELLVELLLELELLLGVLVVDVADCSLLLKQSEL